MLWALIREIRLYIHIKEEQAEDSSLQTFGVWSTQTTLVRNAVKRHTLANLRKCLQQAGEIDKIIKGAISGDPSPFILTLSFHLSGQNLWL